MNKNPVLAYEPEEVLDAWYERISKHGKNPGDVVGQMIPGGRFVWEIVRDRPSLSRIEGIGITQASQSEYDEVLKAISHGQFQITEKDRAGQVTLLHKATGSPLKQPMRRHDSDDSPSP